MAKSGFKSRLLDRSLSLDIAGYYYRYRGLETGVNEPAQNGLPVLRNAQRRQSRRPRHRLRGPLPPAVDRRPVDQPGC